MYQIFFALTYMTCLFVNTQITNNKCTVAMVTHEHMSIDRAIAADTSTNDVQKHRREITFITLGDGDFTWSLDLARYLFTSLSKNENGTNLLLPQGYDSVRLVVTGIDSLKEFQHKYRNYNYTLRELEQFNRKSRTETGSEYRIHVEIAHEINAIVQSSSANSVYNQQGHVIIFNHPHLGTEDAKLHSQFVCHLFHSVQQFWIVPYSGETGGLLDLKGVFYLTLANGQFERWKCHAAAKRHGMKLIHQSIFVPKPSSIVGFTSMYGHRRHQTGKSFASRTSGSTTYTFVRECDHDTTTNSLAHFIQLPWFEENNEGEIDSVRSSSFICSICDKHFREERSLRNHVISLHGNSKRKRSESDTTKYSCSQCNARYFDSLDALHDHIIAKHDGIHSEKVPVWAAVHNAATSTIRLNDNDASQAYGTCPICDAKFSSTDDARDHHKIFIPSLVDMIHNVEIIQCRFCRKIFREVRAQQQHENFCVSRL